MGLEDRESLRVVRSALEGPDSEELIGRFYATWFARDPSVGDLFPPDLTHQRTEFADALRWRYDSIERIGPDLLVSMVPGTGTV